jgi:hypothetical protein
VDEHPETNTEGTAMTEPQVHTDSLIHTEIDRLLDSLDGELTSQSRVIDALLDVRGTTDDEQLVALVDDSLRNVPGKNSVKTDWLRNQLTHIGLMSELSLVAGAETTTV